ncbi:unnamed protein product, partial [Amoebophrya sp. A25]
CADFLFLSAYLAEVASLYLQPYHHVHVLLILQPPPEVSVSKFHWRGCFTSMYCTYENIEESMMRANRSRPFDLVREGVTCDRFTR